MRKTYFLAVLAYFKNEAHILHEWILHYEKWGIEHIYLVDNGSLDNYNISTYIESGYVTLYVEPLMGQQHAYNKYLPMIKEEVTWLGMFDLDEFLYTKEEKGNVPQVIREKVDTNVVKIIMIQMMVFLPSTFKSTASTIDTNVMRQSSDSDMHPKCLFNMDLLDISIFYNRSSIHGFDVGTEEKVHITWEQSWLCINHYRYCSFENLYGMKEGKGGGVHKSKYLNYSLKLSNQTMLENDYYLRSQSKDVISKCKYLEPMVNLYPKSTWMYLKENYPQKHLHFTNLNAGNKTLSRDQVYEIALFMHDIQREMMNTSVGSKKDSSSSSSSPVKITTTNLNSYKYKNGSRSRKAIREKFDTVPVEIYNPNIRNEDAENDMNVKVLSRFIYIIVILVSSFNLMRTMRCWHWCQARSGQSRQ